MTPQQEKELHYLDIQIDWAVKKMVILSESTLLPAVQDMYRNLLQWRKELARKLST